MATMTEALDEIDAELQGAADPASMGWQLVEYVKFAINVAVAQDVGDTDGEAAAQATCDAWRAQVLDQAAT